MDARRTGRGGPRLNKQVEPQPIAGEAQTGWVAAVAQLLGPDGSPEGAGFLVAEDVLVTCAHVVRAAGAGVGDTVHLRFAQAAGTPTASGLVLAEGWKDPNGEDIAVVRLQPIPAGIPVLPLAGSGGRRGHDVRSFGFPTQAGPDGHFGYGRAGDVLRSTLLQLTAANDLTQGFSGGPVWDDTIGAAIGMITAVTRPDHLIRGAGIAYATSTAALRAAWPPLTVTDVCPYRGPEPFGTDHAGWFHGRGDAIDKVLAGLADRPRSLLLLGPSGAGKSSLIQAGVVPALAQGRLPGSERWPVIVARRGPGLSAALAGDTSAGGHRVVVVDQFEEMLTSPSTGPALEELTEAFGTPRLTVVLVMRDDFYPQLAAEAPGLLDLVGPGLINIPASLSRAELHDIITKPAAAVGARCQEGLPERIIADVLATNRQAASTVLPLLEVAMKQLWERQSDGTLTHDAYERIGGLSGSITSWCNEAIAVLPESGPHRQTARRILTALVRPADPLHNIPAVRQERRLTELRDLAGDPSDGPTASDEVLALLADHRVIVTRSAALGEEPGAELAHEALIRNWVELRRWVEQDEQFQRWLHRAEEKLKLWAGRHDREDLLRGSELSDGLTWTADRRLPREVAALLAASRRAAARATWIRRVRRTGLAILVVAAVGAAAAILRYTAEANEQHVNALSQQLAARSRSIANTQAVTARQLATEAWSVAHTPEAADALTTLLTEQQSVLAGHTGPVTAVAFPPDGARLASGGDDGTVRLWNAATGQPIGKPLTGHAKAVTAVAFGRKGRVLASASKDTTVQLWDVTTGQPIGKPLTGHRDRVNSVAFSPDGARLATASGDGTVRLWNADTGDPIGAPVADHTAEVNAVAFSPDGRWLASASGDRTVRLRDPGTGQTNGDPLTSRSSARAVTFDPRSALLAAGDSGGEITLWDPNTRRQVRVLSGHQEPVLSVTFSPGGTRLASTSVDKTVRLWNPATGAATASPVTGHGATVWSASFNTDGHVLATAGADGTIRLWDPTTGRATTAPLPSTGQRVTPVFMSPTSTLMATSDADNTVQLMEITTGRPFGMRLQGSTKEVNHVAADPRRTIVATAGNESVVRVWNPHSGKEVTAPLDTAGDYVAGMTINRSGTLLVTSGEGDTVRVWDTATGGKVRDIHTGGDSFVHVVAFTPDGTSLLTAGSNTGIGLWDATTGLMIREIKTDFRYTVTSIAFSPDGRRLAIGSSDEATEIRDPVTGDLITRLRTEDADEAVALAFSADSTVLVVCDKRGMVRLWDIAAGRLLGEPRTGHRGEITGVALSADGVFFETVDKYSQLRVWHAPVPTIAYDHFCARYGPLPEAEWLKYAPNEDPPPACKRSR